MKYEVSNIAENKYVIKAMSKPERKDNFICYYLNSQRGHFPNLYLDQKEMSYFEEIAYKTIRGAEKSIPIIKEKCYDNDETFAFSVITLKQMYEECADYQKKRDIEENLLLNSEEAKKIYNQYLYHPYGRHIVLVIWIDPYMKNFIRHKGAIFDEKQDAEKWAYMMKEEVSKLPTSYFVWLDDRTI